MFVPFVPTSAFRPGLFLLPRDGKGHPQVLFANSARRSETLVLPTKSDATLFMRLARLGKETCAPPACDLSWVFENLRNWLLSGYFETRPSRTEVAVALQACLCACATLSCTSCSGRLPGIFMCRLWQRLLPLMGGHGPTTAVLLRGRGENFEKELYSPPGNIPAGKVRLNLVLVRE